MSNRSPTEEFGRQSLKVDITTMSSLGLVSLLSGLYWRDPYHALDVASYMLKRAAGPEAEPEDRDSALLRAAGQLAVQAVEYTAWPLDLRVDIASQWQTRVAELDTPELRDIPAA